MEQRTNTLDILCKSVLDTDHQKFIRTKDLWGNPKPRLSPDRTGTGPGSGNILKNIFGSGNFISGRSG